MPDGSAMGAPPLRDLLRHAAGQGGRWLEAEWALARAQGGSLLGGVLVGIVLGSFGAACLIAALTVLSQAAVVWLASLTGGFLAAASIVGGALLFVSALFALAARRKLHAIALPIVGRLSP